MTEQTAAPVIEARPVQYLGRDFNAVLPTPEQILVWKRTMERLGSVSEQDIQEWTGEQTLAALVRLRKIIDSVISPADIDWIDDQMLTLDPATGQSRFTFKNAHDLLMTIVRELQVTNREERRAAKEPAPAARRKPAKKASGRTVRK